MDARPEDSIRAEISAFEAIPMVQMTEHHFKRLNDLEAEIRRRHPELQQAGAPAGSFQLVSFEDLLSLGLPDFNPHVVARARRRFSSEMFLAITEHRVESAVRVYEQTLALPQTATEAMLNIEGYELNGPWHAGNDNLIICYKGTIPHLLKALTPKEITRGSALFIVLKEQAQVNPFLTTFDLRSHDKKVFMIMPYYPSTLEGIRKLSLSDGVRLFDQVRNAIDFLHSLNYNHMDIKPANICLRENGDFVLIDLGSVAMKLAISESTVVYVPRDFQPRDKRTPNNRYKAVDVNDWLMLGMTIAEKVYGLEVGGAAPPPTVEGLIAILGADGAFGELITLFH